MALVEQAMLTDQVRGAFAAVVGHYVLLLYTIDGIRLIGTSTEEDASRPAVPERAANP
jgi:hypothetical protein